MNEKLQSVQRMQDYIAQHLDENITPADLSTVSMYSPWYTARMFKELTGYAPADYIRRLRLSKSALKLRDSECRILDLALDFGFGSVDGYQRAFRRAFGCNPHEYAKRPVPIYLFTPYGVKFREEKRKKSMEDVKTVFIQVIEKPARKAIIKRGVKSTEYFEYCEEVGCDVWGLLTSMKSLCGEPVCLWLPEKFRKPNTSEYVQGVEVEADYSGEIPDGFDVIDLPAAKYLMFQGSPFEEENFMEAIDIVQHAMTKYNPAAIGYSYDKENPRIQLEPLGERGYIEMVAVK